MDCEQPRACSTRGAWGEGEEEGEASMRCAVGDSVSTVWHTLQCFESLQRDTGGSCHKL